MSAHAELLAYDPTLAGTSNAQRKATGAGGGNISGAGNYYGIPFRLDGQKPREVSEIIDVTGTLAGTLTIEVSNDLEMNFQRDTAKWVTFTPAVAIPAINGVARFGMSNTVRYKWYRLKFVYTSGAGTLESRTVIKES